MSYTWEPEGVSAETLREEGLAPTFDSRDAAEEWLSSNFDVLADIGVDAVSLLCDGTRVYGPMPLTA